MGKPAPHTPVLYVKAGGAGGGGAGGGGSGGAGKGAPDYEKYPECGYESHPVDVVTGRAFTHPIMDLELPGPLPLEFKRMYSSTMADRDVGLGWGWAHTFGWRLDVLSDTIAIWNEQGVRVDFPPIAVGQELVGAWGWKIARDSCGYTVDADDEVLRRFEPEAEHSFRHRLAGIWDANGNRLTITYDRGQLAQVVDSVGRVVHFGATADGHVECIEVEVPGGARLRFATYGYDGAGNLVQATDADGFSARYEYDELHRLTADTDRCGLTFHFVYDNKGRCVESWGDYGDRPDPSLADGLPQVLADGVTPAKGVHHCRFTYFDDYYSEAASSRLVSRFFGNRSGSLEKSVRGRAVVRSTYDDNGLLLSQIDEVEGLTAFERDERGALVQITDALGGSTKIRRDARGLPVEITDAEGAVTRARRDARGNVEEVEGPAGGVTRYVNDERGQPVQYTQPNGAVLRVRYDAQANPVELTQPNGGVWKYAYDPLGRLVEVVEPAGGWMRYSYSNRGDVIAVSEADGSVTHYSYDGERHLVRIADAAGTGSSVVMGGYHRVCERQDENGHVTRYRYDREGKLLQIVNAQGEVHELAYSPEGELVQEKTFDGRAYHYKRDAAGRVIEVLDPLGHRTVLRRDAAGNILERALADGTIESFEYDKRGDLLKARNPAATVTRVRDLLGRIVSETTAIGDRSYTVEAAFDLMNRRIGRRTSLGHTETFDRDLMGNPTRTVLGGALEIRHAYDPAGREIARWLPGGARIDSELDGRGRLRRRVALRPTGAASDPTGALPLGITAERGYRYEGSLLREITGRRSGPVRLDWDPAGQLAGVARAMGSTETFQWDSTGNLFEPGGEPRAYGRGNRLLQKGQTQYVFDAAGRLVEKRRGGEVWRYAWSAKDLLESVSTPDGTLVEYRYDAFCRRVEKRVSRPGAAGGDGATVTTFVWDEDNLVHELRASSDEQGARPRRLTYCFEDESHAPLAHEEQGARTAEEQAHGWLLYLADAAGTPEALLTPSGQVASEIEVGTWGAAASSMTPLRFAGQYADEETGLSYQRFRYYDPDTGTFISADPIGLDGELNAFAYVSDPFGWIDPLGLKPTANMRLGQRLEDIRVGELQGEGWEILPSKVGAGNGPDIVAVKRDSKGNITAMRIEECKANSSRLRKTKHGKQMSDEWLKHNKKRMKDKGGCVAATAAAIDEAQAAGVVEKYLICGTQSKNGRWKRKPPKKL